MSRIEIDYSIPQGFGSNIGFLSFLASSGLSYRIYLPSVLSNNSLVQLAKLFQISSDLIEFVVDDTRTFNPTFVNGLDDNAKVYSKYISAASFNLFGTSFKSNTGKRKNYICLTISGSTEQTKNVYFNNTEQAKANNNFPPKLHTYTRKEIDKIMELIVHAGYDVITLESSSISLEQKIFIMNELCDAVIGYEGGMMHLAHCLGVPSIIFPWADEHNVLNNWLIPEAKVTRSMIMHLDKRTYFIDSPEELHSWDSNQLKNTIADLLSERGNNILLNKDISAKIAQLDVDTQFDALCVPRVLKDITRNMKLSIGGYD